MGISAVSLWSWVQCMPSIVQSYRAPENRVRKCRFFVHIRARLANGWARRLWLHSTATTTTTTGNGPILSVERILQNCNRIRQRMVWGRGGPAARNGSQQYDQQAAYQAAETSTPHRSKQPTPASTRSTFTNNNHRNRALNPNNPRLNESLQTQYIDLGDDDQSFLSSTTRTIAKAVGTLFTPGQVLAMLRVLRAATLSFLALALVSMLMYLLFVQCLAVTQVRAAAGGLRDVILRLYGILFAVLLVAVELDVGFILQRFAVLKSFVPRACVFWLVAQLCAPRPIAKELADTSTSGSNRYYYSNDDTGQAYSDYEPPEIPTSAIGFQRVTSFLL